MDFLTYGLTQECTLWVSTGTDGYNQPSFAAPVQIICRWEEKTEKIQGDDGVEVLSRARVFLAQDVALGDYLVLGTSAGADPREVPGAYRVKDFRKTPSLDGLSHERKAYL